ncbi:MAG: nitronate monooxygenase [Pseudomonadota bacterium]|nr:nitronate monooxygenase [Pseudomonadota bacterium]
MSRWPDNRFLELVGCGHPIIQAPMANAGGVELCVAAIDGGALGSLPCGMLSASQIREQVGEVRGRTVGPINLNFLCHQMPQDADDFAWRQLLERYYDRMGVEAVEPGPMRLPFDDRACAAVEELKPEVVSFHYGLPARPLLDRVKASGALVLSSATTVAESRWLEERGIDAVIAQGFEAGGHSGRFLGSDPAEALGLIALLPQIVDAVSVPVIAAGGIADGRGIAAAFVLGASAVQIGTAYLMAPESLIAPAFRQLLTERPTIMSNLYSGGLARAARGRLIDELGAIREEAPPFPLATAALMPLWRAAQERGDWEFLLPLAGQSAALAARLPASQLTEKLTADALSILGSNANA